MWACAGPRGGQANASRAHVGPPWAHLREQGRVVPHARIHAWRRALFPLFSSRGWLAPAVTMALMQQVFPGVTGAFLTKAVATWLLPKQRQDQPEDSEESAEESDEEDEEDPVKSRVTETCNKETDKESSGMYLNPLFELIYVLKKVH